MPVSLLPRVLDALLPPRCLVCGDVVEVAGALCHECWTGVSFLGPPQCEVCGLPFELAPEEGDGARCGACLGAAPAFRRARAVFSYEGAARSLVLAFKHADRTDMAPAFARWMARAGADLLAEADLLVPVPLHWRRLFGRRYNQSALLAQALGRDSGIEVAVAALRRCRATPSQGRLGRLARSRNVRGAFQVPAGMREVVQGRSVLLIDDVMTSGATVGECASVLKKAGARAVDALTLARVALAD